MIGISLLISFMFLILLGMGKATCMWIVQWVMNTLMKDESPFFFCLYLQFPVLPAAVLVDTHMAGRGVRSQPSWKLGQLHVLAESVFSYIFGIGYCPRISGICWVRLWGSPCGGNRYRSFGGGESSTAIFPIWWRYSVTLRRPRQIHGKHAPSTLR